MHATTPELIGPDFLANLAEQQLASGLEIDAATLRNTARAWSADRAAIAERDYALAQMERDHARLEAQLRQVRAAAQEAEAA